MGFDIMRPAIRKSTTCLAVLRDKFGRLVFAGDRRQSWDFSRAQAMTGPKIAKRNGVLLAGTGCGDICHELTHRLPIPSFCIDEEIDDYVHLRFMPSVFEYLRVNSYLHEQERRLMYREKDIQREQEMEWYGAIILVGIKGQLYELTVDNMHINIGSIDAPFAHGCGGDLAWGSLLTTENSKKSPEERLRIALTVAARVSVGCDTNIDVLYEVDPEEVSNE